MTTSGSVIIGDRKFKLAKRIGKGGEGEVYRVKRDPRHAVKLYTSSDTTSREPKIDLMIRADLAQQAPQVAFPLAVARTTNGLFTGFQMKLVTDHKPLHELYSPGSRKQHFPHADYRFLVRTAVNISEAVAAVHRLGCVIGDINHSSILVSNCATVTLIDSDSFQIESESQLHLCRVGVPEYTPPELQGRPLTSVSRTENHDAFGLAVIIFQTLFMGRHPFIGTIHRGEAPLLAESIRDFRFVYTNGRDVGMDQPPGTPALSEFPKALGEAFECAFAPDTKENRPTALTWVDNLVNLESGLIPCTEDKLHWYPREAPACPWCAMERESGTVLFGPYIPAVQPMMTAFGPRAPGFTLAVVRARIANLTTADRRRVACFVVAACLHIIMVHGFATGWLTKGW